MHVKRELLFRTASTEHSKLKDLFILQGLLPVENKKLDIASGNREENR